MDDVDPITLAIVAVLSLAEDAVAHTRIQEGYAGLLALIVEKFGTESAIHKAVQALQTSKDSKWLPIVLSQRVAEVRADFDSELVSQASALLREA
jgi:hypothetical protein